MKDKIPDKCLDCRFFRLKILENGDKKFNCMLNKPLVLAPGCPNSEKDDYSMNIK